MLLCRITVKWKDPRYNTSVDGEVMMNEHRLTECPSNDVVVESAWKPSLRVLNALEVVIFYMLAF